MPTGEPSEARVDSVPSLTIETMVRAVSAGGGLIAARLPLSDAKHRSRVEMMLTRDDEILCA